MKSALLGLALVGGCAPIAHTDNTVIQDTQDRHTERRASLNRAIHSEPREPRYANNRLWETNVAYLLEHTELFRSAYINLKEGQERSDGDIDIILPFAYRLDRNQLAAGLFGIDFSVDRFDELEYRDFSSREAYLKNRARALAQIDPTAYTRGLELLNRHSVGNQDTEQWEFLSFENLNPEFPTTEANSNDRYIETTFGLAITREEAELISRRAGNQNPKSVREYLDQTKRALEGLPYRDFESEDPRTLSTALEDGGNCVDLAYTFAKVWLHSRAQDPRLAHTHVIPTSIYRADPSPTGYTIKSHKIVTIIQTDTRQIAFYNPTQPFDRTPAEAIRTMIHK